MLMTMHQNKSLRSFFLFKYQINTSESFKQIFVKLLKNHSLIRYLLFGYVDSFNKLVEKSQVSLLRYI